MAALHASDCCSKTKMESEPGIQCKKPGKSMATMSKAAQKLRHRQNRTDCVSVGIDVTDQKDAFR